MAHFEQMDFFSDNSCVNCFSWQFCLDLQRKQALARLVVNINLTSICQSSSKNGLSTQKTALNFSACKLSVANKYPEFGQAKMAKMLSN